MSDPCTHVHTHTISLSWPMDTKGTLSSPYPPCDIVMPHFSQRKSDGDMWWSRPFYSSPGGYKFFLCVVANGYDNDKGKRTSVFVCLMKGENDHQLQWPFERRVTCSLLNWKGDEYHIPSIQVNCSARGRLNERASPSLRGQLLTVPHVVLRSSGGRVQYLNEDSLCLQVHKVEPLK